MNINGEKEAFEDCQLLSDGSIRIFVKTFTGNIFQTVKTVVQVLAIAAVIFAGVRYMFASADGKADIKQQTIILIVGAILVFAAVPILNLVQNISNNLIK